MATTTGFVQRLTLLQDSNLTCAWVGPSPSSTEAVTVSMSAADTDEVVQYKRSLVEGLTEGLISRRVVEVSHPDDSAAAEQVWFPQPDAEPPVRVEGIEVTQGIQDLGQSIPLVAGKRTVIRVYLGHPGSPGITVRGGISVRRGPADVPFLIESENVAVLDPAEADNLPIKREDVDRSLNFVLPATDEGPLHIELVSVTDTNTNTGVAFSGDRRPVVWFHASAPLRLRVIGFRYTQDGVAHVPTPLDFALLQSWLERAFPIGQLILTQTVTDVTTEDVPFGCGDINSQLAALRVLDMDAGGDERTHYYGLVSDGGFFMRGCAAGIPQEPMPDTVASGPTGPGTWGWDLDGSYGDWYGAHELGHTLGRRHPGFCGESESDLDNYPFENGQLANGNDSFVGFDVGDPANGIAMRALPGTQWHDVMTYCARQWMSAYTYLGIRRRLDAEDALDPDGTSGPAPGARMMVAAPSGGRPDERFPHAVSPAPTVSQDGGDVSEAGAGDGPGVPVSVVATVNLTAASGEIRYVTPLERRRPMRGSGSDAVLQATGADGTVLGEFPVQVRLDSEILPGQDLHGLVDAVVEVDPAARTVELVVGSKVVDRYRVGGTAPQMRAVRAEATIEGLVVAGEASEAETATYAVQVSTDNGRSWQTVAVGRPTPSVEIDRSVYAPGQTVRVRVIATNGLDRSVALTDVFRT